MHCSYTIFQFKFCSYIIGTLGTRLTSKMKTFVWTSCFFCFRPTWKKFLSCPKRSGKQEEPLFNYVGLKTKKGNNKRAYELFAFSFLGFEICANRFSIKFFISSAAKLENPVKIFLRCPLYTCKTGKCWNQHVFTNLLNFVKFWF